jgi:hypothetical protein
MSSYNGKQVPRLRDMIRDADHVASLGMTILGLAHNKENGRGLRWHTRDYMVA